MLSTETLTGNFTLQRTLVKLFAWMWPNCTRFPVLAKLALCVTCLPLLAGCPAGPTGAHIDVQDARVRQLLPGQTKTVAYADLTNNSPRPINLVSAHSDSARSIEIHQSTTHGDMVAMRRVESIVIPGEETVRLAPGGLHLMLFGVADLPPHIDIELFWADGQVVSIPFRRTSILPDREGMQPSHTWQTSYTNSKSKVASP